MRFAIPGLKWVLLGLYILVVAWVVYMVELGPESSEKFTAEVTLGLLLLCQVIFVFGAGTRDFLQPIRPRRLLLPVIVAGLMMAILVFGLCMALGELLYLDNKYDILLLGCIVIALTSWTCWGILFYFHACNLERYKALRNLTAAILAGSLLELLVTVPAHLVVTRRPGCMLGMWTMLGIIAGIVVMFWAFGPGIILLFFREKRQAELMARRLSIPTSSKQ